MFFPELLDIPPVLDFEASSLEEESYPISAGLVSRGHSHYWVIKPEPEWTDWSTQSERIHGLSRLYIEKEGLPARQVYNEINEILWYHEYVVSDAPEWDRKWLLKLGVSNAVFRDARSLLSPDKTSSFSNMKEKLWAMHNLHPHRADHDAIAIALTLQKLGFSG